MPFQRPLRYVTPLLLAALCACDDADDSQRPTASSAAVPDAPPAPEAREPIGLTAPLPDDEIRYAIRTLFRRDRSLPDGIDVSVRDRVVTLKGTVPTLSDQRRLLSAARGVRSVFEVRDRIRIDTADVSDSALREDVRAALAGHPVTEPLELDVAVVGGSLVLEGTVDSWQEKRIARRLVQSIEGVRQLDDRLRVEPATQRSSSEIREDVRVRVALDPQLRGRSIRIRVDQGRVTLEGSVRSDAERNRAFYLAHVPGVHEVHEALRVERDDAPAASMMAPGGPQLEQVVRSVVATTPQVDARELSVSVRDGVVMLAGGLPGLSARRQLLAALGDVVGVWKIDDRTTLAIAAEPVSDEAIRERVERRLRGDPGFAESDVSVKVDDGTVQLLGVVDSVWERRRAQSLTEHVAGVREVDNSLVASLPADTPLDDATILSSVRRELSWIADPSVRSVEVRVDDGTVALKGTVATLNVRQRVVDAARASGAESVNALGLTAVRP